MKHIAWALLSLVVLAGCTERAETPANVERARLNKSEMAARELQYKSRLAAASDAKKRVKWQAQAKRAADIRYGRELNKFTTHLLSLPDVAATQIFGGDGVRVFLRSSLPDDQAKFIANAMYRQFVQIRSKYMNKDKAITCTIFLKDENGDSLYDASYYTQ